MVAPDYQEFANLPNIRYPWQYRDLPGSHEPNLAKSAKRCAIVTLPNQHESGTFSPCEGMEVPSAAGIAAATPLYADAGACNPL